MHISYNVGQPGSTGSHTGGKHLILIKTVLSHCELYCRANLALFKLVVMVSGPEMSHWYFSHSLMIDDIC